MTSKDNELDEILFMAFVGLWRHDEDGNFVSLDDKYGVLKDHLKQEIKEWAAQEANKAVVAELQSLYDYATSGTRVKTLLGNRIAQLTEATEVSNVTD